MTIFFSQIQTPPNYQILTGTFSTCGRQIEKDTQLLLELRKFISSLKSCSDQFYVAESANQNYKFYINCKQNLAFSIITEASCSQQTALKYFANIEAIFFKQYSPGKTNYSNFNEVLKVSTNKFNEDVGFMEIGADLEKTKGIYAESLNALYERGAAISNINDLAAALEHASKDFKDKCKKASMDNQTKTLFLYLGLFLVLFVFIYYFILR